MSPEIEAAARSLNMAGWTCYGGGHEPGQYDACHACKAVCDVIAADALDAAHAAEPPTPGTPHLYALELYLRDLRADGAASGTVRTVGLEGALGEVRELRERLAVAEGRLSRVDKVWASTRIRDEDLVRSHAAGPVRVEILEGHVRNNLLRELLDNLAERVTFSVVRDDMRAEHEIRALVYVIRPEIPAPLELSPETKAIQP